MALSFVESKTETPQTAAKARAETVKPSDGAKISDIKTLQDLLRKLETEAQEAKAISQKKIQSTSTVSNIALNAKEIKSEDLKKMDILKKEVGDVIDYFKKNPTAVSTLSNHGVSAENAAVVAKVIAAIPDSSKLTPESSPYVYGILSKALKNEIKDPLQAISKDDLTFLKASDSSLFTKVVDGLADIAKDQGKAAGEIAKFKSEAATVEIVVGSDAAIRRGQGKWDRIPGGVVLTNYTEFMKSEYRPEHVDATEWADWIRQMADPVYQKKALDEIHKAQYVEDYSNFFNLADKKEVQVIAAVHDPEIFKELLIETRRKYDNLPVTDPNHNLSPQVKDRLASEEVKDEIVLHYAKLSSETDNSKPQEFMDNILNAGYNDSITSARLRIVRNLLTTISQIEKMEREAPFQEGLPTMYRLVSNRSYEEKEMENGKVKKVDIGERYVPTPGAERVNPSEFLRSVRVLMEGEDETKGFLHNVRAMQYLAPRGEGGPYKQLAGYAGQMRAIDLDSMHLLPDSDMFHEVFRLYTKYLETNFAVESWIHRSHMFASGYADDWSAVEKEIYDDISHTFRAKLGDSRQNDWRLRRAMTYGIGLAKGVYLTEQENASWADPEVDKLTGKPTYRSYYFQDNTLLMAFNPMHDFFRWQAEEGHMASLLFTQVKGYEPKIFDKWEHRDVFDNAKRFFEAFANGENALWPGEGHGHHGGKKKMFYEMLCNISRVGSLQTRGGWRMEDAYTGWLKYKNNAEGIKTGKIDHKLSWKLIENMGFEVLLDYTNNKLGKDSKFFTDPAQAADRNELFAYIHKEYIDPSGSTTYQQELSSMRAEAEAHVKEHISEPHVEKPKTRADYDNLIEVEVCQRFIFRALYGVMRDRMPTKFVRIERNRTAHDGERLYIKLEKHFVHPENANRAAWTVDEYNKALKDIMKVESMARRNTSRLMHNHLKTIPPGQDPSFLLRDQNGNITGTFELPDTDKYKVDEISIDRYMREYFGGNPSVEDIARIQRARDLYREINRRLFDRHHHDAKHFSDEFADKIRRRNEYFPFALGTEEIDTSFMGYSAAGPTVLKRMYNDIALGEDKVSNNVKKLLHELHHGAIHGGDEAMNKIVAVIVDMKKALEGMHSHYAIDVAEQFAALTIAWFKKDTAAQGFISKWGRIGVHNSLAAEFLGVAKGVWEWDARHIDKFLWLLSKERAIPSEPYDLNKGAIFEKKDREILGIKVGTYLQKRRPDFHDHAKILRDEFGVSGGKLAYEFITKWLPLLLMYLAWKFASEGLSEASGTKK